MHLAVRLALALVLAGAATLALPEAPALLADGEEEDGDGGKEGEGEKEGGEGGEEGEVPEGEKGEKPTMDGAIEVADARRHVAVKVPKSWKAPDKFEPDASRIAVFIGPITDDSGGAVEILVEPGFARAALALHAHQPQAGVNAEDLRSGPGWAEGAATSMRGRQSVYVWERAMEKEGTVYCVRVLAVERFKAGARDLARQILDTAKVLASPAKPQPPSGFAVKKVGDYDVWSDAEDKGAPGKVAELAAPARDALVKALKGKPFDESRPVLRVCQLGAPYLDLLKPAYGEAPRFCAYDPFSRSVAAQLHQLGDDEFPGALRECAARQYLAQYFGGLPPFWVDTGLRRYAAVAVDSGGKADKPKPAYVEEVKNLVKMKHKRLDEWMDATGGAAVAPDKEASAELWAWHVFFRHGAGKKYAKQYQASLDALRQAGDVPASRKAWEGVDFKAMGDEFRAWVLGWK